MARKPRIHYPGALYHVMLRGNGGQKIFFDVKDREVFNDLIKEDMGSGLRLCHFISSSMVRGRLDIMPFQ